MDQISPPMRIVLVVAIVFAAAWMLVLKPKDEVVEPAPATPVPAAEAGGPEANTALGKAVENARETAGAAESAQQARSGESESANAPATTQSNGQGTETAPGKPAEPVDESLADLPKWLRSSMDKKVVAILFTNAESADDRRTSKALQRSYGDKQDVVTRVVNVKKISAYQAVAEGVDVSQSPTLLVIARDRSATALSGYATLNTINQTIIDALLVTDNPAKKVPFLQELQQECRAITNRDMIGVTEGETPLGARRNVEATVATMVDARASLVNAPVPGAYKAQKAMTLRWLSSEIAVGRNLIGALGGKVIDPIKVVRITSANDKLAAQTRLELNAVGVSTCN